MERRERTQSEDFESSRDEQWIYRREPRRWPRLSIKRISKAFVSCKRGGNAASLLIEESAAQNVGWNFEGLVDRKNKPRSKRNEHKEREARQRLSYKGLEAPIRH